jgi:hypothetical protein
MGRGLLVTIILCGIVASFSQQHQIGLVTCGMLTFLAVSVMLSPDRQGSFLWVLPVLLLTSALIKIVDPGLILLVWGIGIFNGLRTE